MVKNLLDNINQDLTEDLIISNIITSCYVKMLFKQDLESIKSTKKIEKLKDRTNDELNELFSALSGHMLKNNLEELEYANNIVLFDKETNKILVKHIGDEFNL
ncbi:hypothetical protein J3E07_001642 [Methanococcus voltae]|uniref:Uncharacterized protein n=1 Tax=Methanococcus voltae TaxID=2188 RepID=A0A8J7UVA3_METVO|nr:hypothetical protein [Methanococcus voltae]MBP2202201.1 hypothetical protein [Methanococcus voltae]